MLLGVAGWATTIVRCLRFARHSDLHGLPRIGTRPAWQSRLIYRAVIAWLHLIHPLSRVWGRIRGMSSMPHAAAPEHMTRRPWKVPFPRAGDVLRAARLAVGRSEERSFWSETWVAHSELLTEIIGLIRAARPAPLVDVDEGWRADRDFSLAVGRWGWLHVRTLIEEHAGGRCLFRVHTRFRMSLIGISRAVLAVLLLAVISAAMMSLHRPSGRVIAVMAFGLVATRTAWQVTRGAAVLDRALLRAMHAAGMWALPARTSEPAQPLAGPVAPDGAKEAQAAPGA